MNATRGRRQFMTALGAAALLAGCRARQRRGPLVLRLSHSMSAGATALHAFAEHFKALAEAATGGAVTIRLFPSGTLGQEREVVQQLQEGLVDFMVSGTAIWGSVAPRLQVFDFPFLWRDWPHVHRVLDGPVGGDAAAYIGAPVRMRPLAWGDSFGFRQVVTRSRDVRASRRQLAGLKIRTIQSPIYVKAVELMGASPTPMAFGEVYTSLQTGVIDGYEHDASTTAAAALLRGRPPHGADPPHRRRARAVRLASRSRAAAGRIWSRRSSRRRARPRRLQRLMGPAADEAATADARGARHDHPRYRRRPLPASRRGAVGVGGRRARRRRLARGHPRVTAALPGAPGPRLLPRRALDWTVAGLVVAQALVVGLQVVARHLLREPMAWTEEIARLLLVWLMCVGGIAALRRRPHPASRRCSGCSPTGRATPSTAVCDSCSRRSSPGSSCRRGG